MKFEIQSIDFHGSNVSALVLVDGEDIQVIEYLDECNKVEALVKLQLAEKVLKKLEEKNGQFIHKANNLLQVPHGFSNMLLRRTDIPEEVKAKLQRIIDTSEQLKALINAKES